MAGGGAPPAVDRASGWAVVVDRAGEVAVLEPDAASTYGFDPVR